MNRAAEINIQSNTGQEHQLLYLFLCYCAYNFIRIHYYKHKDNGYWRKRRRNQLMQRFLIYPFINKNILTRIMYIKLVGKFYINSIFFLIVYHLILLSDLAHSKTIKKERKTIQANFVLFVIIIFTFSVSQFSSGKLPICSHLWLARKFNQPSFQLLLIVNN